MNATLGRPGGEKGYFEVPCFKVGDIGQTLIFKVYLTIIHTYCFSRIITVLKSCLNIKT